MPSIYRKTAKGQAEIETRANKLPPRLRAALIMVDGKRSHDELSPMLLQAPDETLAALLADGFIEVVGKAGPAAAAPSAAPSAATAPAPQSAPAPSVPAASAGTRTPPVPLSTLQREAVRLLNEQCGPAAEALALRIERVRSIAELRVAVVQAAQVIANIRGRQAAEAYAARFADI